VRGSGNHVTELKRICSFLDDKSEHPLVINLL
jgi:hypothetical protein